LSEADVNLALDQVGKRGSTLKYVPESLQRHKQVVMRAVQQDGLALQYALYYQKDKAVVMAAVRQNGNALQFAHSTLQADWDVVSTAVEQDSRALFFACKPDTRVVRLALKKNARTVKPFMSSSDAAEFVAKHNGDCLQYLDRFRTKNVIYAAIETCSSAIRDVLQTDQLDTTNLAQHYAQCCHDSKTLFEQAALQAASVYCRSLWVKIMHCLYATYFLQQSQRVEL
jgi:hypothetical protein